MTYQTILVPTDGSECANHAAEWAFDLAERHDAAVHGLSVADTSGTFVTSEQEEALQTQSQGALDDLAELADGYDVAFHREIAEGAPHEVIVDQANSLDADLTVMGTHGRTGVSRYVVGSVTERVVRTLDRPVLTVRDTEEGPEPGAVDTVLVPTDGSDAATAALDDGVGMVDTYDAALHLAYVVDIRAEQGFYDGGPATGNVVNALEEAGKDALEELADRAEERGVSPETHLLTGTPATSLLGFIEDEDIDLVAMGTHGRSGLDRLLLGSTTEKILRRSDAPVLTVGGSGES